jgi:hypothetical protein
MMMRGPVGVVASRVASKARNRPAQGPVAAASRSSYPSDGLTWSSPTGSQSAAAVRSVVVWIVPLVMACST